MTKAPSRIYAGLKIHNWIIVSRLPNDLRTRSPNLRRRVKVKCVCGKVESLPLYYLMRDNPKKSCGCLNRGIASRNQLEYRVWYMMNRRCQNPEHQAYRDYGGRGITVCERWHKENPHGFANFLRDMGPRRRTNLTLDRIDVNGSYNPSNCRWATWDQQNNNKRLHLQPPPEIEAPELGTSETNDEGQLTFIFEGEREEEPTRGEEPKATGSGGQLTLRNG
jgi:hypothetical protein